MAQILLWAGICLIVVGWIALAWQAAKVMTKKAEIEKFPGLKERMQLRRSYCRFAMMGGVLLILVSLII